VPLVVASCLKRRAACVRAPVVRRLAVGTTGSALTAYDPPLWLLEPLGDLVAQAMRIGVEELTQPRRDTSQDSEGHEATHGDQ
jgi:nitrate/nitrite-specific signal transduction histidine kinase